MKLEQKTYETHGEKRRDFLIGFGGWFGINAALLVLGWIASALVHSLLGPIVSRATADVIVTIIAWLVPLLINVGGLIYLGFTRKWMALGALAAIGVVLLLVLCATAACFIAFPGY